MFNRKKSKSLTWLDTLIDAIPAKPEPKHRLRNGLIVTIIGAGTAAAAAALAKKGGDA